jgi:hypothetical protein
LGHLLSRHVPWNVSHDVARAQLGCVLGRLWAADDNVHGGSLLVALGGSLTGALPFRPWHVCTTLAFWTGSRDPDRTRNGQITDDSC